MSGYRSPHPKGSNAQVSNGKNVYLWLRIYAGINNAIFAITKKKITKEIEKEVALKQFLYYPQAQ